MAMALYRFDISDRLVLGIFAVKSPFGMLYEGELCKMTKEKYRFLKL